MLHRIGMALLIVAGAGPAEVARPHTTTVAGWQVIDGDQFTAIIPGSPEVSHEDRDLGWLGLLGSMKTTKWQSMLGEGVVGAFILKVTDYTFAVSNPSTVDRPMDRVVDAARDAMYAPFNGTLNRETRAPLRSGKKEWPGREIVSSLPGGSSRGETLPSAKIRARLYTVGNRLYVLMLIHPPDKDMDSEFKRFVDGFRLK